MPTRPFHSRRRSAWRGGKWRITTRRAWTQNDCIRHIVHTCGLFAAFVSVVYWCLVKSFNLTELQLFSCFTSLVLLALYLEDSATACHVPVGRHNRSIDSIPKFRHFTNDKRKRIWGQWIPPGKRNHFVSARLGQGYNKKIGKYNWGYMPKGILHWNYIHAVH